MICIEKDDANNAVGRQDKIFMNQAALLFSSLAQFALSEANVHSCTFSNSYHHSRSWQLIITSSECCGMPDRITKR
jgi:hypothetical protein